MTVKSMLDILSEERICVNEINRVEGKLNFTLERREYVENNAPYDSKACCLELYDNEIARYRDLLETRERDLHNIRLELSVYLTNLLNEVKTL